MKRKIINAMILLCMIGVSAKVFAEDNSLRISKVEIAQGTSSVTVPIYLDNSVSMCGFEVFIELPEGITLKHEYDEDEEEYVWGITKGGRLRTEHGVNCAVDNNGYIHLLCADLVTNKNFYDSDTKKGLPLVTLELSVDPSMEIGSYEVILHDILLNHNENPTIVEYTPDDVTCPFYVKPTSGVYTNLHDGILEVLTGIGEEISATDLVEAISSYQNVTCIDVTGVDFDATYSTSDMKGSNISNNVLVIVGEEDQLNGNNIVCKDECANLVITDGYNFAAPVEFTAANASYEREMTTTWGTIVLPFDVASDENTVYYLPTEVEGSVLKLTRQEVLPANTPAVVENVSGSGIAVSATNVDVADDLQPSVNNSVTMYGSYANGVRIDNPSAYYINNDKFWLCNEYFYANAFRGYFTVADSAAKALSIIAGDDITTGVDGVNTNNVEGYYDLSGKRFDSLQKGVNIVKTKTGESYKVIVE